MKFELEQYNRNTTDDVLLEDLRQVASELKKENVTKSDYEKHGRFSPATLQNRFGSWCKSHELAGLKKIRNFKVSPEDCVNSIKTIAQKIGKPTITTAEYLRNGGMSLKIIARHFGSWKAALELAGLNVSPYYHERASEEELFENIEHLWELLGRQPKTDDFSESYSKFSKDSYKRRFGSLRKALEAFIASFEQVKPISVKCDQKKDAEPILQTAMRSHKTSRNPSWRLKFLVMRRDHFRCCICGLSPALKVGTILVVDHILPWDSGGETYVENLQTLCQTCNGGKSNLSMEEG